MRSCLYVGRLRHERTAPEPNAFTYPVYSFLLDLDELDESRRARALPAQPARPGRAARHATTSAAPGRAARRRRGVLRIAGRRRARRRASSSSPSSASSATSSTRSRSTGAAIATARSRCVVAEVHNTFGERHPYLLRARRGAGFRRTCPHVGRTRRFHVSPFMDLEGRYRFELDAEPGELLSRADRRGARRRAVLPGRARGAAGRARRALARARARRDGRSMTFQVSALIRWQALRLVGEARAVPPQAAVRARARLGGRMSGGRPDRVDRGRAARGRRRPPPDPIGPARAASLPDGVAPRRTARRAAAQAELEVLDWAFLRRLGALAAARARRGVPGGRVADARISWGCSSCSPTTTRRSRARARSRRSRACAASSRDRGCRTACAPPSRTCRRTTTCRTSSSRSGSTRR